MHQVHLVIVSKNSDTSVYKIGLVIGVMRSQSFFIAFGNHPDSTLCLAARFEVPRVALLGKAMSLSKSSHNFNHPQDRLLIPEVEGTTILQKINNY
jgi:hypothetical protein